MLTDQSCLRLPFSLKITSEYAFNQPHWQSKKTLITIWSKKLHAPQREIKHQDHKTMLKDKDHQGGVSSKRNMLLPWEIQLDAVKVSIV